MRTQRSAYVLDATDMSARSAAGREITLIAAGTACPCGRNHDQSRKALVELLNQSKLRKDAELEIELRTLGIEELRPSHLPGVLNETADALSRLAAPGSAAKSFPTELAGAKCRQAPVRGDEWYRLPTPGRRPDLWGSTKAEGAKAGQQTWLASRSSDLIRAED